MIRLTITITDGETAETVERLSQKLGISGADVVTLAIAHT
jgi:hypothetical protein